MVRMALIEAVDLNVAGPKTVLWRVFEDNAEWMLGIIPQNSFPT
jgi:hypothetical protein